MCNCIDFILKSNYIWSSVIAFLLYLWHPFSSLCLCFAFFLLLSCSSFDATVQFFRYHHILVRIYVFICTFFLSQLLSTLIYFVLFPHSPLAIPLPSFQLCLSKFLLSLPSHIVPRRYQGYINVDMNAT